MTKTLYVGIFSGQNIGDLVISNQIVNFIQKEGLHVDLINFITLEQVENATTEIRFNNNISPHQKIKKILLNMKITSEIYTKNSKIILDIYSIYKESFTYYLYPLFFREYIKIIDNYDFVCIGGGNLLMTLNNNSYSWAIKINRLIKIAKDKRKKVFIISVGAGPILSQKANRLFSESLNMADYITVRDENSKRLLEDTLNVKRKILVSGDPALLLDNVRKKVLNRKNINVAISIIPFGKRDFFNLEWYKDSNYYMDMYEKLITYLHKRNPNFVFHLFSSAYTDYEIIPQLEKHIKETNKEITEDNLKVVYVKSADDLLKFYQSQDLLIGTRMHSLIIAFTQSIPIIAISWQGKVTAFMDYVNLSQYCYNLNSVNDRLEQIYIDSEKLINDNREDQEKLLEVKQNYAQITSNILHNLKQETSTTIPK
jgi:polysaccharide pyruvyl transferase WcaK-like protein